MLTLLTFEITTIRITMAEKLWHRIFFFQFLAVYSIKKQLKVYNGSLQNFTTVLTAKTYQFYSFSQSFSSWLNKASSRYKIINQNKKT